MSGSGVWGNRGARGGGGGRGGGGNGENIRNSNGTNGNSGRGGGAYPPLANIQEAALSNGMENVNLNANGASGPAAAASGNGQGGSERRGGRNGNNEKNGEGKERRGAKRGQKFDLVKTRKENYSKSGTGGKPLNLVANFFKLTTKPQWTLYNYRVDFKNLDGGDEEERTTVKKKLLNQQRQVLSATNFIFDGSNMYTVARIMPDPMLLTSQREDGVRFEITIRLVTEVAPWDVVYLQFFNIIMRTCLSNLKLDQIGRHYYDHSAWIELPDLKLTLLPGYITNIRHHDAGLMMCVEVTHKVLRTETCLDVFINLRNRADIKERIVDSVVMTSYNNKTYKIDDIDWDSSPRLTFEMKGTQTSLADYYKNKYNLKVSNGGMNSPLLVSLPTRRDRHRGQTGNILLIPEFCRTTGLTSEDRANYRKMQVLSQYLQQPPQDRYKNIVSFFRRLRGSQETSNLFKTWNLDFEGTDIVGCKGRVLNPSTISFGDARAAGKLANVQSPDGDWTASLRKGSGKKLAVPQGLNKWVIIATGRDIQNYNIDELIRTMRDVGSGMGIQVSPPEIVTANNNTTQAFNDVLDKVGKGIKSGELDLIFVIIPYLRDGSTSLYSTIKRKFCMEIGVKSQCFQSKHLEQKNIRRLMSVCTMLMTQISAKLGGEPWKLQTEGILTEPTMIVGFDVHHPGRGNRRPNSYGAMVSTTNPGMSTFFSTVSKHDVNMELSTAIAKDIIKCVVAFQIKNSRPPSSIIFYRDGVGEGQLEKVYNVEVKEIKERLKELYTRNKAPPPKLTFIVVTKKGNARIFTRMGEAGRFMHGNPPPGTIVDGTITLPERYDFFLISQQARKDQTVSPTTYNVIHDEIGKSPSEIQNLSYKLCHMYFNWAGTVSVPAVCQYAHKLAFLTGTAISTEVAGEVVMANKLSNFLYFL